MTESGINGARGELEQRLSALFAPDPTAADRLARRALARSSPPGHVAFRAVLACVSLLLAVVVTVVATYSPVSRGASAAEIYTVGQLLVARSPGRSTWIVSPGATIRPSRPSLFVVKGDTQ